MFELQERAREEISQAKARMVYAVITALYLAIVFGMVRVETDIHVIELQVLIGIVFIYSIALILFVRKRMTFSPLRQVVTIVIDIGTITLMMDALSAWGAAFYPLYLWVISGNGLRFGIVYLWFAMALGFIGFTLLIIFNSYWQANLPTGIGLVLGVLILPTFFAVLIRRLHQLNARLQQLVLAKDYQASHDDLTGLCNRSCFKRRLNEEIARAQRNGQRFSVLYLDLDGFKDVNDRLGHEAGDRLLKSVAQRLLAEIRSVDLAVRLGGDEFVVLTMSGDATGPSRTLMPRIKQAISAPYEEPDVTMSVGVSIGEAIYPDDGTDAESLMRQADARMYQQKGRKPTR
ncbi:MAG: diguanylate cyclase [Gammaproteobacteria bacterium]|nr:diguanylate cyclase [Gammaproteobacteria bacterium]